MVDDKASWIFGFIGVAIFSGSLPATRIAVADFDPLFLTVARATIAGALALILLVALRQKRPEKTELPSLLIVAFGVVVGFPLLTALALEHITAARSVVFIGLLPLATAIFGTLRTGNRPSPAFWIFALIGSTIVVGFALTQNPSASSIGDIFMFAAIIVCGLGYAEGAKLARTLGGWQVISWALILSLPVMAPITLKLMPASFADVSQSAWLALAYVSIFSMLVGFIFWYRGLAHGGVAAISQLQLLQPFMGLLLSAALIGETVSWQMIGVSLAVIICVAGAKRSAP